MKPKAGRWATPRLAGLERYRGSEQILGFVLDTIGEIVQEVTEHLAASYVVGDQITDGDCNRVLRCVSIAWVAVGYWRCLCNFDKYGFIHDQGSFVLAQWVATGLRIC